MSRESSGCLLARSTYSLNTLDDREVFLLRNATRTTLACMSAVTAVSGVVAAVVVTMADGSVFSSDDSKAAAYAQGYAWGKNSGAGNSDGNGLSASASASSVAVPSGASVDLRSIYDPSPAGCQAYAVLVGAEDRKAWLRGCKEARYVQFGKLHWGRS